MRARRAGDGAGLGGPGLGAPVPETAQVPITVPVRLSRCSSMLPPLVLEATRASNDVAPVPKATFFTLM